MFSIKSPDNQGNCIYDVIRPLYLIGRLSGFFPFSVKIQMNGKSSKVYITLIDTIVFVIHMTVYGSFAYINIQNNLLANDGASPLLLLGTRTLLLGGILNGMFCISADLCNRFRIFKIFDRCQMFDSQMKTLGSQLNYKRNKLHINICIAVWIAASLTLYAISYFIYINLYSMDVLVFIFPSYFLVNATFIGVLAIYSFFLFSIKSRFHLLNEYLRLSSETRNINIVSTSNKDTTDNLMKLADLHDLLNEVLVMVNGCYSIQVMLAVGMCFSYTVFCLFSGYRGWIARTVDDYKQFNMAIVLMIWAVFYYCFVITVLWTGHSTRNEGKFTGTLLHRTINRCSNTEIVGRLLAFSQQLNHRTADASCTLFSFDWTLFYSMVAATATYLIILIQFDASGSFPVGRNSTNTFLNKTT